MGDKYNSLLEGATSAILLLFRYVPFPMKAFFLPKSKFSFSAQEPWTIVHGLIFGSPEKGSEKRMSSERASQGEQNGTNFSFVAPSSEEL